VAATRLGDVVTRVVIIGFALCVIVVVVVVTLWWAHDNNLRDHAERLAVLEDALNLGGQPQALVDEPVTEPIEVPTEPMPRLDVAAGVRVAREANRPRPTPFPRPSEYGRHAAR
jgi:hypothetical protein